MLKNNRFKQKHTKMFHASTNIQHNTLHGQIINLYTVPHPLSLMMQHEIKQ